MLNTREQRRLMWPRGSQATGALTARHRQDAVRVLSNDAPGRSHAAIIFTENQVLKFSTAKIPIGMPTIIAASHDERWRCFGPLLLSCGILVAPYPWVLTECHAKHHAKRIRRLTFAKSVCSAKSQPRLSAKLSLGAFASRTTYHEAVQILVAKGLVEFRPKFWTRVTDATQWHLLDPDVLGWMVAKEPPRELLANLFELCKMVEPEAAALAAERPSAEHLN
jgi:hypothetical protein